MDRSYAQRRTYVDTFSGGSYSLDLEENLGSRRPHVVDIDYVTDSAHSLSEFAGREKALYEEFLKRRAAKGNM